MKKTFRIYKTAWVIVLAVTLLTIVIMVFHTSHHDLARDPNNLEKIVKVDLPEIASYESDNNLDRGASRWDTFEHRGQFTRELSEETITVLDKLCLTDSLHWRKAKDKNVYSFYDEGGIDGLYYVFCLISREGFVINYEVDESEGIFALLPLAIAYSILFKWGLGLIVISLVRKIKSRKKNQI